MDFYYDFLTPVNANILQFVSELPQGTIGKNVKIIQESIDKELEPKSIVLLIIFFEGIDKIMIFQLVKLIFIVVASGNCDNSITQLVPKTKKTNISVVLAISFAKSI